MTTFLCLICVKRVLKSFVDELDDWKGEGATVSLYGPTEKENEGFILVTWDKPVPAKFRQKLREDVDVLDYFTIADMIMTTTITRPAPQL